MSMRTVAVDSDDLDNDHPSVAVYAAETAPVRRTLVEIFQRTADEHPSAIALETSASRLTYRELAAEAADLARRLRTVGVGPGSQVGVRVPSGTIDLYLAILGVLHAGAAYVLSIGMTQKPERLSCIQRPPLQLSPVNH